MSQEQSGRHTFSKNQLVKLLPGVPRTETLQPLHGHKLLVADYKDTPPHQRSAVMHHQLVKVRRPGTTVTTDWISAVWFEPI